MAVNTAALKTFAPAMRRQLMEAVGRKLDLLLNNQTPDTLSTYAKQIAELREEGDKSREQLLERVAYTWFNRLCALRYLDARGWHPFGCKVLMPTDGSETQPELLKLMRCGSLPADLKTFTNEQRLNQLLDGQIPTAIPGADAQGEVYRELVLASCRSYHQLLPDLFEGLDDASELLLPDDLLTEGSIAGRFRSSISDSDCDDVEIIGWLYQFYISEKKDEVIGKVVKSEDIPAATQLFTPNWIVKYMVQNTIGAQWLATYPDSNLRAQMEFYIEPAEQTDEVKAKLAEITPTSLNPEELTLMDPACGSGHILVEAYEIFKAIYLEQGYQLREIPKLIFEKNLFGLDIDQRAAQLTTFALTMKGRDDDKRLFERGIQLNVVALQDSTDLDAENLATHINLSDFGLKPFDLAELKQLFQHSSIFGSLIEPSVMLVKKLPSLIQLGEKCKEDVLASKSLSCLLQLARQAELLASHYDAVAANPPYMGSRGMCNPLREFTQKNFPESKRDLFACFIERGVIFAKNNCQTSMVTMQSWMFLSSFEEIRKRTLRNNIITSMIHLGSGAFGSISGQVVQATAFVLKNKSLPSYRPTFHRLIDGDENDKLLAMKRRLNRFNPGSQSDFKVIPGSPLAYWLSDATRRLFDKHAPLGTIAEARQGLATTNNERFLRLWHEVDISRIGLMFKDSETAARSNYKWFPFNKGGSYRKWYGNHEYVINFMNDGQEICDYIDNTPGARVGSNGRVINRDRYFRPSVSWSDITSSINAFREYPAGFIHDAVGHSAFGGDIEWRACLLSYCNNKYFQLIAKVLNPTLHFHIGYFNKIPYAELLWTKDTVRCSKRCVELSKDDWNSFERSWEFKSLPLLQHAVGLTPSLKNCYSAWISTNQTIIAEAKHLEEENNRIFIDAYALTEELTSDVPVNQVTLTVNPSYRYGGDGTEEEKWDRFQRDSMAELLSYATGCMMGRYSLDCPGLILADSRNNQDDQLAAYEAKIGKSIIEIQFKPDADAIIPVLDGEWFEDDIVARTREFLKVTFSESRIAENLRFVEDSIGKDIRKYFCKDFYKDHLQTYKKRPIYWMVQSPKAGFACLIYLHRYTPDTLLQVLNNYFRPYLQKLEARQEQLERDQNNVALPKREQTAARKEAEKITKVLKECQAWEQDALLPLAQQRIELDLDDGVKVNYLKLQEVLAKIPGLAAKGD